MHGGITEYTHRIGRTGRIGRQGQATAFYNESDEGIATDLVKLMMEQNFEIPDFLDRFKPADGIIAWDDRSDEEFEANQDEDMDTVDAASDTEVLNGAGNWGSSAAAAPITATASGGW